jgi:hypothetical protein
MTDIVERLRSTAALWGPSVINDAPMRVLIDEAADEIERLRANHARRDALVRANARDNARFSKPKPVTKKNRL